MAVDVTRAEVLDALKGAWGEWDALAEQIPRERIAEPGMAGHWAYKDVLAHLMGYERYVAARIRSMITRKGPTPMEAFGTAEPPAYVPGMTDDDQNAMIYELYRSQTPEAIQAEARRVRAALVDAIESLLEDQLNQPAPWTGSTKVSDRIADETYRHREEHMVALREWLDRS